MIVHLKYNNNNYFGPQVEEVTFDDAKQEELEKIKLKGHYAFNNDKYFDFFYNTENINLDEWDIKSYIKDYVKSLVILTKPYVICQTRKIKLNKIIS